jgi:hypothetical protein
MFYIDTKKYTFLYENVSLKRHNCSIPMECSIYDFLSAGFWNKCKQ